MSEPLAYAVMHVDSEFDYRIFADKQDAEDHAMRCAPEEGDAIPEVVPLLPALEAGAIAELVAAAGEVHPMLLDMCQGPISLKRIEAAMSALCAALAKLEGRA